MEIIDLPPIAPTLIESTRAIGYSLEAAVADIIDNSIAAKAEKIEVSFFPLSEAYVTVLDNGSGMDAQTLTAAMQYGSQSPHNERDSDDLGRYGLGMKTASLSQCRRLTVASKCSGKIEIRRWDIDFVTLTARWSLISLTEKDDLESIPRLQDLDQLTAGTLVVWQKLDRMEAGTVDFTKSMGRQFDKVRDYLSLVYHRYLSGETGLAKIVISVNGKAVEPADPFMLKKSDRTMQEEVYNIHGALIKVQPYILPHISKMTAKEIKAAGGKDGLRKRQGFYIYRNRRLIVWGTWFGMMRKGELSKLARIRVDIPNTLDDLWTLDIKKSSAMPPEEVRTALAKVIENIGEKSRAKFTRRGRAETDESQVRLWNRMRDREGGYYYEINRKHPLVTVLEKCLGNDRKILYSLLSQIEKTIPLNQLYIDLNNDERICNDEEPSDREIEEALKSMIPSAFSPAETAAFIDSMAAVPPFKNNPAAVEIAKKELIDNGEQ